MRVQRRSVPTLRMDEHQAASSMFLVPGVTQLEAGGIPWYKNITMGPGIHMLRLQGFGKTFEIVQNGVTKRGVDILESLVSGGTVTIRVVGGSIGSFKVTTHSMGHS